MQGEVHSVQTGTTELEAVLEPGVSGPGLTGKTVSWVRPGQLCDRDPGGHCRRRHRLHLQGGPRRPGCCETWGGSEVGVMLPA